MDAATKRTRGRPRDPGLTERRREEILAAATRLFARDGHPNADLQVLADVLGVGKGTIYRYFPTKGELFLAAVDHGMRRLHDAVSSAAEDAVEPLERVAAAIRAYLDFFARNPDLVELLIQERAEFRDREKPTYFQHRDAGAGPWRALFRRLIALGHVREVPVARITDTLSDLVYGTMFTNHFTRRRRSSARQAQDILDVVFNGILTESGRAGRASKARGAAR